MGRVLDMLRNKTAHVKAHIKVARAKQVLKTKTVETEKLAAAFDLVTSTLEKQSVSPELIGALKYYGARAANPLIGGAMVGAPIGAIAGGEGHRMEGALRGAGAGALGSLAGSEAVQLGTKHNIFGKGAKGIMNTQNTAMRALLDPKGGMNKATAGILADMPKNIDQIGEDLMSFKAKSLLGKLKAVAPGTALVGGAMAAPFVAAAKGGASAKKPAEKSEQPEKAEKPESSKKDEE